ncbi:MAG: hypothetical protein ACMG57_05600, partial [Candidatus Dojkabacteria bacterium]
KYALGLTTITQDVDDFLSSDYGRAIVNNSSMQMLLKQAPAAIDKLKKVFYLTDGEKSFLMSAGIGQGLFFAGANHVAIQVVASENEHNLITTNPNELLQQKTDAEEGDQLDISTSAPSISEQQPPAAPVEQMQPTIPTPVVQPESSEVQPSPASQPNQI